MLAGNLTSRLPKAVQHAPLPCTHAALIPAPVSQNKPTAVGQVLTSSLQGDGVQHAPVNSRLSVRVAAQRGRPRKGATAEQDADEEAAGSSSQKPRDPKTTAPVVLERGAPDHPYPGEYQQTLISSFTLGGVGLHTGDYAVVRVRPAFANEGRYFVRVPEGTNESRIAEGVPSAEVNLDEGGQMPLNQELEEKKLELFKQYLVAQEEYGFEGTFPQYLHSLDADALITQYVRGQDVGAEQYTMPQEEEPQPRQRGETVLEARETSITTPCAVTVTLGSCNSVEETVVGVEQLLAALEACGVDNARIEIEGGAEVPMLDGSALAWAMNIQFHGVRPAPAADGSGELVRRQALRHSQPFTVMERDSFVSFVPEDNMRLTAGVDEHLAAKVIGKQWKSWSLFEDLPFRFELASARKYVPSLKHLQVMAEEGYFRGGTQGTVMVAFGDRWYEPQLLRHVHDEAARHQLVVLLGTLALMARPGHAGLPFGHVVAYKATPELILKFVRELRQRSQPHEWVDVWDVPLSTDFPYRFMTDEEMAEEEGEEGEWGEGEGGAEWGQGEGDEDAIDLEQDDRR